MKHFSFFFAILIIGIIGYGAYYFYNDTYEKTLVEMETTPIKNIPTAPPNALDATKSAEATDSGIPKEWKLFTSDKYGFSMRIPANMKNDTMDEGDRFYWFGKTQSLGTELYDGISIIIKSVNFANTKTFEQAVKEQYELYKKTETTQSITEVTPIKIGNYNGYKFRKSSMGEGDFIYLPKQGSKYLEIVDMTVHPENKQEYRTVVDQMFSSIKIF